MGRTADSLVESLKNSDWPSVPACVDYGLDGFGGGDPDRRYAALYWAVNFGGVTADQLHHAAMNKGLTELIRSHNPDKKVVFTTANDMLTNPFDED